MAVSNNEIVRDLTRFMDRLLDFSTPLPQRIGHLNAQGEGMRDRLRFLSLPDSDRVAACQGDLRKMVQIIGGAVLAHGSPGDSLTERRLVIPAQHVYAIDLDRQDVMMEFGYARLPHAFAPASAFTLTLKERAR